MVSLTCYSHHPKCQKFKESPRRHLSIAKIPSSSLLGNGHAHKKGSVEQPNGKIKEAGTVRTNFVTRVTSLPILKDSVSTVQLYASKSSIGRYALSTAESTFESAKKYSSQQPYVQSAYDYLAPQLRKPMHWGASHSILLRQRYLW